MAQYRLQVFKRIITQEHEWTNVYHIEAPTVPDGQLLANAVAAAEIGQHRSNVFFTYYRMSREGSPGVFVDVRLDQQGAYGEANDQLPLWNVMRVSFNVALGRPSFKFYRLPCQENEQTNGVWSSGRTDDVVQALTPLLTGTAPAFLVDESGNQFESVTADLLVRERQLHRRRRRTANGGIGSNG